MKEHPSETSELHRIWRNPLLFKYAAAHGDTTLSTCWELRPPTADETLKALAEIGCYTLANHRDPLTGKDEHVCTIKIVGEQWFFVKSSAWLTVAALECLVAALETLSSFDNDLAWDLNKFLN